MKTKSLKNLKMDKKVYSLRRKVIDLIYEARKSVPDLDRIDLRITEKSKEVNGVAKMNGKQIWIPINSAGRSISQLIRTVFHEICHAAFSVPHVKGCPLMDSEYQDISKEVAHRLLKKYSKKGLKYET